MQILFNAIILPIICIKSYRIKLNEKNVPQYQQCRAEILKD